MHKGAFHKGKLSLLFATCKAASSLASKNEKKLKFIKICMADGLLEAKEVGGL